MKSQKERKKKNDPAQQTTHFWLIQHEAAQDGCLPVYRSGRSFDAGIFDADAVGCVKGVVTPSLMTR